MVEKSPTAVAAWESGAKRPTASTVAQLALSLSVDPGFFAVRPRTLRRLAPCHTSARCAQPVNSPATRHTPMGGLAVDIAISLERHVEFPAPDVPYSRCRRRSSGRRPEQAAAAASRMRWGMDAGPVGHLVRLLRTTGSWWCSARRRRLRSTLTRSTVGCGRQWSLIRLSAITTASASMLRRSWGIWSCTRRGTRRPDRRGSGAPLRRRVPDASGGDP